MAKPAHCPSQSDLAELIQGAMPAPQTHQLGRHVLTCRGCVDTLSGMSGGDTLIQQLRSRQAKGDTAPLADASGQQPERNDDPIEPPTIAGTLVSTDPAQGVQVGGYRLLKLIGSGGMGMVYEAMDTELDRRVALKVMRPEVGADAAAQQRFLREARAAAAVRSDHIVTIYQVGQADRPYLAMEFLTGETLDARLCRAGRLNIPETVRISRETAAGLAAAHAHGLIHRDIKPANLWLEAGNDRVKILDFGLARLAQASGDLTASGQIVGTPQFMAPEQARGLPVDVRCDVFSLGAVMYCMLAGTPPFTGPDVLAVLAALAVDDPKPLGELNPEVPPPLAQLIHRLLAKHPDERPSSASEVIAALDVIQGKTESLPAASGLTQARSNASGDHKKHRGPLLVGTAAALTGILMSLLLWWSPRRTSASSTAPSPQTAVIAAPTGPPIKVGVLHSLTGTMADSGNAVTEATLLAIDDINRTGGLLGRPLVAVVRDGQSDWPRFARKAEQLIEEDKVCTIFGCWTSSGRKAVKRVVEKRDHLLVYPVQFEGLEHSPNIVYTGATPNQQIIPAVKYCYAFMNKRRFFLVGSDYVFPRTANAIIRDTVAHLGAEVVGEAYVPLGSMEVGNVVERLRDSKPDVIFNTINGDTNRAFFRALRAAGVTSHAVPTISFSIAEPELRHVNLADVIGDYAAWNYFESVDTPENQAFVQHFKDRFGPQRVTSDPMEAAYFGVHLWAQAVKKAGSIEPAAIRAAIRDQRYEAPEGPVRIDPDTLQTWKIVRLGRILPGGQFEVVWRSGQPVRPEPYPPCRSRAQWAMFLHSLYTGWGGHWAAPDAP